MRRNFVAKRYKESPLWDEWFKYLKSIKEEIRNVAISLLKEEPKVFIVRKNRHVIGEKDLYYWRYIALDDSDIAEYDNFNKDDLKYFFNTDIFDHSFISPSYKITDLMLFIPLDKYFQPILSLRDCKKTKYNNFIRDLLKDRRIFQHYCSPEKAKEFASYLNRKAKGLKYRNAILHLEKEVLLKGFEDGFSIMFPISVGAYYTMAIFLTFKNSNLKKQLNFSSNKKDTFWTINAKNKVVMQKFTQLSFFIQQIPMMMLTKLYSLFFKYLPTIELNDLIKKGLSVMLCVPEKEISVETNSSDISKQSQAIIRIKLPNDPDKREVSIPFNGDENVREITQAQVNEIVSKVYELSESIISEGKVLRLRDAISAIMSRNMSHNLGSHVLFYAEGIDKTLNLYLRERMDFISEIITSEPSYTVTFLFCNELLGTFAKQGTLLSNIARSEGISSINITVCKDKKVIWTSTNLEEINGEDIYIEINGEDIYIAIPTGSIGQHAFYCILENFIRNQAKHGFKNGKKPEILDLYITIEDYNEDFFKLLLSCDGRCKNGDFQKIKNFCEENIIDEIGNIKSYGWGIKEMRFCTAFLRMIPLKKAAQKSEIDKLCPPLLSPRNNNNSFGYEFYMLKPKEALIVSGDNSNKKEQLKKQGIIVSDTLPHEFKGATPYMVISKELIQKSINLPIRAIECQSLDINEIDEKYLLKVYSDWIKNTFIKDNNKRVRLIINLAHAQEECIPNAQRNKWDTISNLFNTNNFSPFELCPIYDAQFNDNHFNGEGLIILLYDMHCVLMKCYKYNKYNSIFKTHNSPNNYYEPLEKHLLKPFLQNPPENEYRSLKFILGLIEAALTNIYVLDERINNHVVYMENQGHDERETYQRMNVIVPPNFNYSSPTKEELNNLNLKASHFVIIHQGILDKAFDNCQKSMEDWIKETFSGLDVQVFVMSGRGLPSNKPQNARFIGASTITKFLITNKSKFHLVQSLFSVIEEVKNE